MDNTKSMEVFSKAPVSKAVLKNALPAMVAMLMVLVYNQPCRYIFYRSNARRTSSCSSFTGYTCISNFYGCRYSIRYRRYIGNLPCYG